MGRIFGIILGVFGFLSLNAVEKSQGDLELTTRLNDLFEQLHDAGGVLPKSVLNDSIQGLLSEFLLAPTSFGQHLEVKGLGKISASNKKVNLYTWNFQKDNSHYQYSGIIQYLKDDKSKPVLFYLNDTNADFSEKGFVKPGQWYGALYYDVVVTSHKKVTTYTVLGWDGNDGVVGLKLIDNFRIDSKNRLRFGYPVFKHAGSLKSRVLFAFSSQGAMMLTYDKHYKRIVFDHLSPDIPLHKDMFQYYGSDFTYDAFRFKKGKWLFEQNIDVRNRDEE